MEQKKTISSGVENSQRMNAQKKIAIIAGPNGAGKTTFAREYLPREADCPDFINVDLIAAGLSPFDPDKASLRAGRLVFMRYSGEFEWGRALPSKQPCRGAATPDLLSVTNSFAIVPPLVELSERVCLMTACSHKMNPVNSIRGAQDAQ